jgi:hypothetical protein
MLMKNVILAAALAQEGVVADPAPTRWMATKRGSLNEEAESNADMSDSGDEGEKSRRLFWRREKVTTRLTAKIRGAQYGGGVDHKFRGTVTATNYGGKRAVTWTVKFRGVGDVADECTGGLNWHVHRYRVDKANGGDALGCGGGATGGHVDPAFGCGGASEYGNTVCPSLYGPDFKDAYGQRCTGTPPKTAAEQSGCEYGDLSGKLGKIAVNTHEQKFTDLHTLRLNEYSRASIVLHCCNADGCKPRLACGDLK